MKPIKFAFFEARPFEKEYYKKNSDIEFDFYESRLSYHTAQLCQGYKGICCFVNDKLDKACLEKLSQVGVEFIALRCAGYNNVDLAAAKEFGIRIARVPSYSPLSIAEFALLQALCLSRKIHRAYQRTRELNFSLEGLVGSTISGQKVGVIGTGQIGAAFTELLQGFGCQVLAYDKVIPERLKNKEYVQFRSLEEVISQSDILSLHVPLSKETHHLINEAQIQKMKKGVLLINTGRGGLIDSKSLIQGIKSKKIGGAALDVYEEEENYFFEDFSDSGIDDDTLARLVSFPNVIVTSHQGFLTETSLKEIAHTTQKNLQEWLSGQAIECEILL